MKPSFYLIPVLALLTSACSEPVKSPQPSAAKPPAVTTALGDTSQNALDWPGEYQGMIPCASCEGIQTHIILRADNSFEVKTTYLGKNERIYKVTGTAVWDAQGRNITLADDTQ
ncbi:MAG: copper resistance protein NlpE, partial [Shewanella sp.]